MSSANSGLKSARENMKSDLWTYELHELLRESLAAERPEFEADLQRHPAAPKREPLATLPAR